MVVLGLILIAAAVVALVEGILANTGDVTVQMWGWTWRFDLFWAMVCGIGILFVALVGAWLMSAGSTRAWRARRDHRTLARENERLSGMAQDNRRADKVSDAPRAPAAPAVPVAPVAPPAAPRQEPEVRERHSAFGRALHRR